MKKIFQIIAVSFLFNSFPVIADRIPLSVQHSFNGNSPLPTEAVTLSFGFDMLRPLEQNFLKHLRQQTLPVHIETILKMVLSKRDKQQIGFLPSASINTHINNKGVGKSELLFPAYFHANESRQATIEWKGLVAQFLFIDQFENMTTALQLTGLKITDKPRFIWDLGKSTLNAQFDRSMMPIQIALHVSRFEVRDRNVSMKWNNLAFRFNSEKSDKGMELGNFSYKNGPLDITTNDGNISFNSFSLNAGGEAQKGLITYSVAAKSDRLKIPLPIFFEQDFTSDATIEASIQNLDENALLVLYKALTPHSFEEVPNKFLVVLPKFIARSPKLNISNMVLKTSLGNVHLSGHISLDGNKVTNLDSKLLFISALQGHLKFKINQKLLLHFLMIEPFNRLLSQKDAENVTQNDLDFFQYKAQKSAKKQIKQIINMGWLVSVDNNYEIIADFKENQLNINGNIMPLDELFK